MEYTGTTICRWCKTTYEFKCDARDASERVRLSSPRLAPVTDIDEYRMSYEYTDELGVPHFKGKCRNCEQMHELSAEEALAIPSEYCSAR